MPYRNEEIILNVLQVEASKTPEKLSMTKILTSLKQIILEEYDASKTIDKHKATWISAIHRVASSHNITVSKRKPSWKKIDPVLERIRDSAASSSDSTSENSGQAPTSASSTSSSNSRRSSTSTLSSSSTTSSILSYLLTKHDKICINNVYQNLDPAFMWKLSTGTVVELKMAELARNSIVEHPCHSLILDVEDETWRGYFTEAELNEIREHKSKELIPPPPELEEYLDNLVQNDDIGDMHTNISRAHYSPKQNPSCYWAQRSLLDGLDLHESHFFYSLSDHSERDFVSRIRRFVLTAFDYSRIKAREEIYSTACSLELNKSRRIGSIAPLAKKRYSKRPDHLYTFEGKELGILEAAKSSDENGNKEYQDALLKSPKTMKNLLLQLTKQKAHLLHSIRVPCLITSGLNMKMLILDAPEGYVCRVISTDTYRYPSSFSTFVGDIAPCLELGWLIKSIMEETLDALVAPTRRVAVSKKRKRVFEIPSCFLNGNKKPATSPEVNSPSHDFPSA